ncbi:MAG: N-acetyltransferase [Phenylobacterium sp.]|uniref:GNAT family N-acetyltransferase n=1 Tax=Phenylobacterium sp. TaxID=1871053 RepID=UPI00120A12F9|nr:GNAT family N-acetyltransferase [Phenylobacterium sp.]TAJ72599.1 MAG: N-acetyltransferase [Phenylobacterium sp.]
MNGSVAGLDRPVLETARLIFRPFTAGDFDLLAELHRDPEVGRYMGGLWPDARIAESLARFVTEHAERGHSKWVAFTREGEFVGRAGASLWPATGELELGYAFGPRFWGQGLATEAARAVADWTFANTDVGHLIAFTHLQNYGSQRVLERIGMMREADRDMGFGELSAFFRMARP